MDTKGGIKMKIVPKRYHAGRPVTETDFFEEDGVFFELAQTFDNELCLIKCRAFYPKDFEIGPHFPWEDNELFPPEEDEINRHMRLPKYPVGFGSVDKLLQEVETFLAKCLDLNERDRFLLACFVLATWVVDRLPVAPYISLVGLPGSGKTTAQKVLWLICRRGLITADISSAAFYRVCDRLVPTLFIDETATAGQKQKLFHLLRSGTTRDIFAFRERHSYRSYGPKVVVWTEIPDDDALNSRCVSIAMQATSRRDLKRVTDPDIIAMADTLQGQLMVYRFQNYNKLALRRIPGDEQFHSRERDLYEALALPINDDPKACVRLLECMVDQGAMNRDPLPSRQTAVLESIFKLIHAQPDQEAYALRQLKNEVNINLAASGERFRLNEKTVSGELKAFGIPHRRRTNAGYVVLIDRVARKRIHELFSLYGIDAPSTYLPTSESSELCEFCNVQEPSVSELPPMETGDAETSAELDVPDDFVSPDRFSSSLSEYEELDERYERYERSERGERGERPKRDKDSGFSSKFIEGAEDEALIRSLQADPPDDFL
jgi:hypothetical protein